MRRHMPHPLLLAALTLMWLLLTRFSVGNLLLGLAISLLAGWAFRRLEPEGPKLRAIWPLMRLVGVVSVDIIRSNLAVAWLVLTNGRHGARTSAFVEIPLRLRNPAALALLAIVVTATPGTAWLEHDAESGILLLHVFDMTDENHWRRLIRDRYEARLLEAFA
ncbi:Na+/H+ antiporter subunit E [Paracoccaceae bacterium Fryx2]|nr:Na+/H+ antiporter subunit E [Paracoccaceae bacterium Fryx2]